MAERWGLKVGESLWTSGAVPWKSLSCPWSLLLTLLLGCPGWLNGFPLLCYSVFYLSRPRSDKQMNMDGNLRNGAKVNLSLLQSVSFKKCFRYLSEWQKVTDRRPFRCLFLWPRHLPLTKPVSCPRRNMVTKWLSLFKCNINYSWKTVTKLSPSNGKVINHKVMYVLNLKNVKKESWRTFGHTKKHIKYLFLPLYSMNKDKRYSI